MRTLLLSLAILTLAGCRAYEGPNLGGTWDAIAGVATTSQSLALAHDPDDILDHELVGTFVDARGTAWPVEADPFFADVNDGKGGIDVALAAHGEWRVTLRGGLLLVDDAGNQTELDVGPLAWVLTHGVASGEERLVLDVKPVQRALGIDPPEGPWRRVTFARRRLPGQTPPPPTTPPPTTPLPATPPPTTRERCAGCGEPLEARWTVCPVCARPR